MKMCTSWTVNVQKILRSKKNKFMQNSSVNGNLPVKLESLNLIAIFGFD